MTDNEIIKALECCTQGNTSDVCVDCPLRTTDICTEEENGVLKLAIDLINRQKAEIRKLMIDNKENEILINMQDKNMQEQKLIISTLQTLNKVAKTEAVKEFAEIVKANLDDFYYTGEDGLLETGYLIDTLVNRELRDLNNATNKLHVGTVEKTRALFQAVVNKFMSIKDLYVIVDGEYLPWEPSEEVEHLFGMSISGDNDEIDKETDRVVKELVGDDNG